MDADCDLLDLLVTGRLDETSAQVLAEKYRNAAFISTPRQLASVIDQIEFLAAVAQGKAPYVADQLGALAARLSGEQAAPIVVSDEESEARAAPPAPRKRTAGRTAKAEKAARRRS